MMASKRRKNKHKSQRSRRSEPVQLLQYKITDEPIRDEAYNRLPEDVKDRIDYLYHNLSRRGRELIPELLTLHEQYPQVQQFSNYLTVAYSKTGQTDKVEQLIQENYERDPTYLFAKIHYAELCLQRDDCEKVAEIFDNKFDLRLLYPHRKSFHISEAAGFWGVMGLYFFMIGEREAAEQTYEALKTIDPRHQFTRRLKRQLYPGPLRRWLLRLLDSSTNAKKDHQG